MTAQETKSAAKPKLAPVTLTHDYWDAEGNRHAAGVIIDLPLDDAKAIIKAGKAERADPMPGEE